MMRSLVDIYSLVSLEEWLERREPNVLHEAAHLLECMVLCDQLIVDGRGAREWGLSSLCNSVEGVFELIDEADPAISIRALHRAPMQDKPKGAEGMPSYLIRAHYYAEAALELGAYLCLHPTRSNYLRDALGVGLQKPVSHVVSRLLDERLRESKAAELAGIDVSVPPVVDHILTTAQRDGRDVIEIVNELRQSKSAVRFRRWCRTLDDELRAAEGRSSLLAAQKIVREVDSAAARWELDLNLGIKYTRGVIALRKLWGIGSVLEVLGLGEVGVKVPMPHGRRSHLLFLNDLYRPLK